MSTLTMTPDDIKFLRTYEDGPFIWDATSLQERVYRLLDLGLIERATGGHHGHQLTAKGREVLDTHPET